MHLYILRRLIYTVPIILGVTLVCFSFIHLAPGDPISAVLPENASADVVREIKAAYGFEISVRFPEAAHRYCNVRSIRF